MLRLRSAVQLGPFAPVNGPSNSARRRAARPRRLSRTVSGAQHRSRAAVPPLRNRREGRRRRRCSPCVCWSHGCGFSACGQAAGSSWSESRFRNWIFRRRTMLRRISRQFAPSWRIRKPARLHRWRSRPILRLGWRLRLNPDRPATRCSIRLLRRPHRPLSRGISMRQPNFLGLRRLLRGRKFRTVPCRPIPCLRRRRRTIPALSAVRQTVSEVSGVRAVRQSSDESRLASAERVQVRFASSSLN
jgi:hypothetical protein